MPIPFGLREAQHPAPARTWKEIEASTTLSVIVPAYNEQFLVEASLARLRCWGIAAAGADQGDRRRRRFVGWHG